MHRIVLGLALLVPQLALADDMISLVDNTKIVGTLVHYYDGVLTVQLPNGAKMQLPQSKVKQVTFQLPKPRPAFSTPRKTFDRMRKAALRGDLDTYIDAHSAYYQMFLNHQIAQSKPGEFRKRLQEEWGNVQLEIVGVSIDKGMATMKVRRHNGSQSQEGEFRFVKENGEWKMILPL